MSYKKPIQPNATDDLVEINKPTTYCVNYRCKNCGNDWWREISFGRPAGATECPRCGCFDGHPRKDMW